MTLDKQTRILALWLSGKYTRKRLAEDFKITQWGLRKIIDPVKHENVRLRRKDTKISTYTSGDPAPSAQNPIYDPRRDPPLHHPTLTALAMGDPLPGRSALDQRRR